MSDLNSLLPILWGGFCTTLAIFALTLLFSIPLGLLVAVLKMSRYRIIRYPVSFYISVMRGTPLLLQIVAIYFGSYYLSEYTGVEFSFDRFPAVIVAFSINYAAYFAEIFRGGIQSIPKGQYEAAARLQCLALRAVRRFTASFFRRWSSALYLQVQTKSSRL